MTSDSEIPDTISIMLKDTALIAFNGEIDLCDFSKAMSCFNQLMSAIAKESSPSAKIRWELEDLKLGSAIATVKGVADSEDDYDVESAVRIFESIGEDAARGTVSRFSRETNEAAFKLFGLINGKITSIRLQTSNAVFDVVSPVDKSAVNKEHRLQETAGAVRGQLQRPTSRDGLRCTLYDINDDHAIECHMVDGMEDSLRNSWGKTCLVSGIVRRYPNGKIVSIRNVSRVIVLEETTRSSWREAVGCAPAIPGSITIEEAVRRVRDE